ncbi:MAG: tyrosine--tRNA ligase [Holosporales bacterium]|jgi:tyrosyl-tRNA synthetase|nr:tyrosine--tRNA ligase [Holosporales bacterium]
MLNFKSEILQILKERDFIYQGTNIEQLDQLCAKKSIVGYIGFDATAKSLQVGNLSAIMLLRWLQKLGHTPVVLVGGGTSRVGDPSFRQVARPIMSLEQISENINGISKVFSKILNFQSGSNKALFVNNADWLIELKYIDFLRDYGCHFTVNRMLSFESIKLRLEKEEPLSFLEFNYMIMQAYDFYYLNKNFGCILQMGGSDQWGNIVNGVELTRRLIGVEVFGLTQPLVTNANGQKMGKTADGAIWLNPDMCAPFGYWQFWRNTDDRDVVKYLKKFTELSLNEIGKIAELKGEEVNEGKKILADEATALLHGKDVLAEIHETAKSLFGQEGGNNTAVSTISFEESKLPCPLADLFVFSGLCNSKGDFKRLVSGNGLSFQGKIVSNPNITITKDDFSDNTVLLSLGKKKHLKIIKN